MVEFITSRSPEQTEDILTAEAECWKLHLKGYSSREIGAIVGRSHTWALLTVGRLLRELADSTKQSVRGHVEKLLDSNNLTRRAAWDGWEKSREDKVKTVEKFGSGPMGPTSEEATTTEGQAGDPAFLRVVIECDKRESALRGIEKPVQPIFQFMQTNVSLDILISQIEQTVLSEQQVSVDAFLQQMGRPEVPS